MSTKYKSKKDWKMGIVIFLCPLLCWGVMPVLPNLALGLISLIFTSLCAWIWFDTFYLIDEEYFTYRCGPLRGKIPIKNIKEMNPHARSWTGVRPALTFKYLRIQYDTYNEVFIAPIDEDRFIEAIRKKNPEIVVKEFS